MIVWNQMETRFVCYGNWEMSHTTIKSKTFGVLVELSESRITNYRSDLWHDALWIDKFVTGPTTFEWVVRDYGTHIGEAAEVYDIERHGAAIKYRFELERSDLDKWELTIYEMDTVKEINVPDTVPQEQDVMEEVPGYLESVYPLELNDIFPIHGNNSIKKGNKMNYGLDRLIDGLREKLDEANSTKDDLEEKQGQIEDAVNELESYIDDMERIIGSLDELPECSIYVDLDTVSFDS